MLTIEGLIAVLSLCVGCFSLGYAVFERKYRKGGRRLRKAAEQGAVHPVYLDQISSKYAKRIETLTSVTDHSLELPITCTEAPFSFISRFLSGRDNRAAALFAILFRRISF